MKTLKLRIRDKHTDKLNRLSGSVNFVWNYVNDLSYRHLQKTGKFFSAYDLNDYTKGSGELLGLHSQTIQAINETLPILKSLDIYLDQLYNIKTQLYLNLWKHSSYAYEINTQTN